MTAIVETKLLTRRFDSVVAVDSCSLTVPRGQMFGLLGANGAGKTTVIKILITLLPPTSGSATVAGLDVVREASEVRRIIGYVPQLVSVDGELTARENLELFAHLYEVPRRERRSRVADALGFMDLAEAADRLVRGYSGGMVRRLEIARAMLHRPQVLFLDEPTVGLDPMAREAVWKHVEDLRSRFGTTILLTTHYMDEAEALCDSIAIMSRGRVAASGTLAELKASLPGGASLDQLFVHYAGQPIEGEGSLADTARERQAARRLG